MSPISEKTSNDDLNYAQFLEDYYSALICVNNTYKEFQDAKKELVQYEEILEQAENLAETFQIKKISSFPKLESCDPISIEITKEILKNFRCEIENFNILQAKLEEELQGVKQESEQNISDFERKNADIKKQIVINNKKIELVKKLATEVCLCSVVFILLIIISPITLLLYISLLMIWIGYRLYLLYLLNE